MVLKEDEDDHVPAGTESSDLARHESSENDGPHKLRVCARKDVKERYKNPDTRGRRSPGENGYCQHHKSTDHRSNRQILRQSVKSASKTDSKHEKPSSGAMETISVIKNDMKAKMGVIREIEGLWGRGFIKSYIPKCHRPLTKRGNKKRSTFREHETDPKNWLPSVLKAILMIAKLTDDKQWLDKAMNDVVRHRIKHTRNRKPQLVTTDFDVIEDMLVKEWDLVYSFEIRYKHLLVHRNEEEVGDEDIDRIMDAGPDYDDTNCNQNDDSDQDETTDKIYEEKCDPSGRVGTHKKRLQLSKISEAPQHSSSTPPRHLKHPKARKQFNMEEESRFLDAKPQQPPYMFGYGEAATAYCPPLDALDLPTPAYSDVYGGLGYYGRHSSSPQDHGMRHNTWLSACGIAYYTPLPHAMTLSPSIPDSNYNGCGDIDDKRERGSSSAANKRARIEYNIFPKYNMQGSSQWNRSRRLTINCEFTADKERSFNNNCIVPAKELSDEEDDFEDEDELDAEVEVMELELKLANLKAERLREKRKRK